MEPSGDSGTNENSNSDHKYICTKCDRKLVLNATDAIVCQYCHCRIFRKVKTEHVIRIFAI